MIQRQIEYWHATAINTDFQLVLWHTGSHSYVLENNLLCWVVRLNIALNRQAHHLTQSQNLGMLAGAGIMHSLWPFSLLNQLHIGLAAHRTSCTAVQGISGQAQLG